MEHGQRPPARGVRIIARRSRVERTADGWTPVADSRQIPLFVATPATYKDMAHQFAIGLTAAERVMPVADRRHTYLTEIVTDLLPGARETAAVQRAIAEAKMLGLNCRLTGQRQSEDWLSAHFVAKTGGAEETIQRYIRRAESTSGFFSQADVRLALDAGFTVFNPDNYAVSIDETDNLAVFDGLQYIPIRPHWPVHHLRLYHGAT